MSAMEWRAVMFLDRPTDDGRIVDAKSFVLAPGATVPLAVPGEGDDSLVLHRLGTVSVRRIGNTVEALLPADLPTTTPDLSMFGTTQRRGAYLTMFDRSLHGLYASPNNTSAWSELNTPEKNR